jgi:tetratricopeptide (TPR) repeat protein
MKNRPVVNVLLALSISLSLHGQQVGPRVGEGSQSAPATFKQEIESQIALFEDAVRKGEANHASDVKLGRLYGQLGVLYEDLGQWARSEFAFERAVSLLRHDGTLNSNLATAISDLGRMHNAIGKMRESEKEEQEALRIRQSLNDKLEIARSWEDLAALSLAQQKYERARDFADQAVSEFAGDPRAQSFDLITARYVLALAYCHLKQYAQAIPLLIKATEDAKVKTQTQLTLGFGEFLLGYAYWRSGDSASASGHLEEGIARMRSQLGWGHPSYVNALGYYAKFLRETRRVEMAEAAEREIRRAETTVDVRALETRTGIAGFNGLR